MADSVLANQFAKFKHHLAFYQTNKQHTLIGTDKFEHPHEAQAYINLISTKIKWISSKVARFEDLEVQVHSDTLEEIMEADVPKNYKVPEPQDGYAMRIAGKTVTQVRASRGSDEKVKERNLELLDKLRDKAVKRDKAEERKPRAKPRANREGLTTIQNIAESLKVEPRDARAALRKLKIEKPDAGWAWSEAEAKAIEAKLKKELKK